TSPRRPSSSDGQSTRLVSGWSWVRIPPRARAQRLHAGGCLIRRGQEGRLADVAALSDRDRAILDFERSWWTEPGPKDIAIRDRFDLSAARYREVLNA